MLLSKLPETTNLAAVVAPGIAEALLSTGIGLCRLVPAVIIYNKLPTDSADVSTALFADEFATILADNRLLAGYAVWGNN
jgi:biopolymer transport protein TolQ